MPRKAQNVPANETSSAKFIRLANQRVSRLLMQYKQLGSLGGPAYQSTPEQVKKIADALKGAQDRAVEQLQKKTVATPEFKL